MTHDGFQGLQTSARQKLRNSRRRPLTGGTNVFLVLANTTVTYPNESSLDFDSYLTPDDTVETRGPNRQSVTAMSHPD